jgi:hypothetical protein
MGYMLDGQGLILGKDNRLFSSPQSPGWLWGPPSLLLNGYKEFLPQGVKRWNMKLTIHLHLVPRSRTMELYPYSPICLYGVVLN